MDKEYFIIKRDGKMDNFSSMKIEKAIKKAFIATYDEEENIEKFYKKLSDEVTNSILGKLKQDRSVYLEDIQDKVELILMREGHHGVAKSYILYRKKRADQRRMIDEQQKDGKIATMSVKKRNGNLQAVSLDKITNRIMVLSRGLSIDPIIIAQKVVAGLFDGIKTREIDDYLSETAAALTVEHPDYSIIAARIKVNALHKETDGFLSATQNLYEDKVLNDNYYNKVIDNIDDIESIINYERDYSFDYFALTTLMRAYLLNVNDKIVERPQDLFMRTAITVSPEKFDKEHVKETYDLISKGYYTHATPTLFNSGMKIQQLSSCFLLAMEDDSINGIFNTLKETALISKTAGGIGIHAHNIRSNGSIIKSTNGKSNGLIPFLKIFNETARCVDQGGGKRKGSFSIYLEPWHSDVEEFLELRKNTGAEEFRARDLFYALWIPDLFMERVENDENWTLMSPSECPGLADVYGKEFNKLYEKYEESNKGKKTIKARKLMAKIIEAQIEAGQPFMVYKDAVNQKSNQKNVGIIKSSNLCAEIVEYSDKDETAVCNLASIALPKFVNSNGSYDYNSLYKVAKIAAINLNRVIDVSFYPTEKTKRSNFRHRPIAVGVQGLADVFFKMSIAYDSDKAKDINKKIFETIYFATTEASMEMAKEKGAYETYKGSPISYGEFQFDMWDKKTEHSGLWDWDNLRNKINEFGVKNSLTTACMPTASTGIILGNTEAFQVQTANIYKRQTLSGEFMLLNRYLVKDLIKEGIWNKDIRDKIILENGSIKNIPEIPVHIKDVYKTVWETSQKTVIDMASDRAPYIDQTQSMNLWLETPTFGKVSSMHMYAWKKGLKTGMYYLRSRSAVDAVKMTVNRENITNNNVKHNNEEECLTCSA